MTGRVPCLKQLKICNILHDNRLRLMHVTYTTSASTEIDKYLHDFWTFFLKMRLSHPVIVI